MAVRYGTFRICVLRTSHLELYRTSVSYSVQFLKRTVPTYRTRTITKKAYRTSVPNQRTVPVPLQKGVPYQRTVPVPLQKKRTVPAYRTS